MCDVPIELGGRQVPKKGGLLRTAELFGAILAAVAMTGCDSSSYTAKRSGKLTVFVSILPQVAFVERVGGARVEVQVLVAPGQSYHSYEPTPKQISELSQARVYCRIGIPFEEGLLGKIEATQRGLLVVDTTRGIPLREMAEADPDESGAHGHEAGAKDPHTWMSPRLVKIQARNIRDALVQVDSAGTADYDRGLQSFVADLDRLDSDLTRILSPFKGREFFVFHPAYGYFGDAYGLRQVAVEEEGKEPSGRRLAALIDRARRSGVKIIFVQPQFARHSAEVVASAIGGAVVPLDPLARDYLTNMRELAEKIASGVGGGAVGAAAQMTTSR